jgi:hypothetical protein
VAIAHTPLRRSLLLALAVILAAVPVVGWFAADVRPGAVEAACFTLALAVAFLATRTPR